jgi:hypothetical protein
LKSLIDSVGILSKLLPILVEGHVMPANLVVFEMSGFDIILGMDWLSKYYACVDCFCKEIVFKPPGKLDFIMNSGEAPN